MNNLFRHIEYLLQRHECVILPGIGAFIVSDEPARFDVGTNSILPPSRKIVFNQSVTADDGLLANSFSRKLGISFEEGRMVAVRECNILKATLAEREILVCGNIGTLISGDEGNLIFKPSVLSSSPEAALGYPSVEIPDVNAATNRMASCQVSEVEDDVYSIVPESGFKKAFRIFGKISASVAVVALLVFSIWLIPLHRDVKEDRASVVPVNILSHKKEQPAVPSVAVEERAVKTKRDTVWSKPVVTGPTYYLIVGTFSNKEEADRFVAFSVQNGDSLFCVPSRKVTRVALAASSDREELRAILNSLRISKTYPGSWIWNE